MSQSPPPQARTQVEFGSEENRTFTELADSMGTVALLMKLVGLAFLVFTALLGYQAYQTRAGYAPLVGVAAATLICLTIGFQTSSSAQSFRRIVESQNRDVWHLMNALQSLKGMYGLLRLIILASIVLLVVAVALWVWQFSTSGPPGTA